MRWKYSKHGLNQAMGQLCIEGLDGKMEMIYLVGGGTVPQEVLDKYGGLIERMPDMIEALEACARLLQSVPTMNGLSGLAVLEHAQDLVKEVKSYGR